MKNKILVTGAAGFIGYHTSSKLLELGYEVVGIDNLNNYYDVKLKNARLKILKKNKNFIFHKLDFTNFKLLNSKLKNHKFQAIIHLGAQAGVRYSIENPFTYVKNNFEGTLNIFEFAKENKIQKVIFASTSSVYGKNEKQPFEESDVTDSPVSVYAATKKSTEVLAHVYANMFGMQMIALRFFTVYGPWGRPDMAYFSFTKNILENKKIEVYNHGNMKRSFTYISDIVDGIVASLNINSDNKYVIYNLGGDTSIKLMDFIMEIERALGKKARIVFKGMQKGDVEETVASSTKSKKDLNYKAKIDIKAGIKEFVHWYKKYENY